MSECINQAYVMNGPNGAHPRTVFTNSSVGADTVIGRFLATVSKWQERVSSRHALLKLDNRMLRDIGISRADAVREADKPFWKC